MVVFNYANRELTAKIVYYGPGLCGKTTNLEYIHKKIDPQGRGQMLSLATETDRTLFFDLLPVDLGSVGGFSVRIQLFTVPGQTYYNATRRIVLRGADGVVFVADSQETQFAANLESWKTLEENLKANNLDINTIPLVLQLNKQDLESLTPDDKLREHLNYLDLPVIKSSALTGAGVLETFKVISKKVMEKLQGQIGKGVPAAQRTVPAPPRSGGPSLKITTGDQHISENTAVSEARIKRETSLERQNIKTATKSVESWVNLGGNGLANADGEETVKLIGAIKNNLVNIVQMNRDMNTQYEDLCRLMDKLAKKLSSNDQK